MKENIILVKFVDFLFGLYNFYTVRIYDYSVEFQGTWNRGLMACILDLGAKYSRVNNIVTLKLSGCSFIFCY